MNIFFLDNDIQKSVQSHCDKHVVKLILESYQMLTVCSHAYIHHPMTQWVRFTRQNFEYCQQYFILLLDEYKYRYDRQHSYAALVSNIVHDDNLSSGGMTPPPLCMPRKCIVYGLDNPVTSYRNYYRYKDRNQFIMRWTRRDVPVWMNK